MCRTCRACHTPWRPFVEPSDPRGAPPALRSSSPLCGSVALSLTFGGSPFIRFDMCLCPRQESSNLAVLMLTLCMCVLLGAVHFVPCELCLAATVGPNPSSIRMTQASILISKELPDLSRIPPVAVPRLSPRPLSAFLLFVVLVLPRFTFCLKSSPPNPRRPNHDKDIQRPRNIYAAPSRMPQPPASRFCRCPHSIYIPDHYAAQS
jgi:hypothetical protein